MREYYGVLVKCSEEKEAERYIVEVDSVGSDTLEEVCKMILDRVKRNGRSAESITAHKFGVGMYTYENVSYYPNLDDYMVLLGSDEWNQ